MKGDHEYLLEVFKNLGFEDLPNPQIDGFWRAMLSAGSASPEAVEPAAPEAVQVPADSASPEAVQAPTTWSSAPRYLSAAWAWACAK